MTAMTTDAAVPAIVTTDLRKQFGKKVAVAGLNLTVEHGEVFGFLGPNGAGKTTALNMMLGLVVTWLAMMLSMVLIAALRRIATDRVPPASRDVIPACARRTGWSDRKSS